MPNSQLLAFQSSSVYTYFFVLVMTLVANSANGACPQCNDPVLSEEYATAICGLSTNTTMGTNVTSPLHLCIKNTGTTTWIVGDTKVRSVGSDSTAWTPAFHDHPTDVASGQVIEIPITVTSSSDPGTYVQQWQMHYRNPNYTPSSGLHPWLSFGNPTAEINVQVDELPEEPSVPHNVHLIDEQGGNIQSVYAILPALRTTNDGRIGLRVRGDGLFVFKIIKPELLVGHYADIPGVNVLGNEHTLDVTTFVDNVMAFASASVQEYFADLRTNSNESGKDLLRMRTLCDGGFLSMGTFSQAGTVPLNMNPTDCPSAPGKDCYELTMVYALRHDNPSLFEHRICSTPVDVSVTDPKTSVATINTVKFSYDQTICQNSTLSSNEFAEPTITGDGRLLIADLRTANQNKGIMYSMNSGNTCDILEWTNFKNLSEAPFDPMVARYGFAKYPLREADGTVIQPGEILPGGVYPWIDKLGRNIFFTHIFGSLDYFDPSKGHMATKYPDLGCVSGVSANNCSVVYEEDDVHKFGGLLGHSFFGLWSHGKIIHMDNRIDNSDLGFASAKAKHRKLQLYDGANGSVQVGTSVDNTNPASLPPGVEPNLTIIDSLESVLNHNTNVRPRTNRDVVWIMNTGKTSAEVAFDDYINPNALIVSSMTAPIIGGVYRNGFEAIFQTSGLGFTQPVLIQNEATALSADILASNFPQAVPNLDLQTSVVQLTMPPYGVGQGTIRIEPVASGGVVGKGLWLDGDSWVEYEIPPQPQNFDETNSTWFVSLWIDPRFSANNPRVRVLSFPDGSWLDLVNEGSTHRLILSGASGLLHAIFPFDGTWVNIALISRGANTGGDTHVYTNGDFNKNKSTSALRIPASGGTLLLGGGPGLPSFNGVQVVGLRGWIDDFKVISETPHPEVICNHAHGTMASFQGGEALCITEPELEPSQPVSDYGIDSAALEAAGYTLMREELLNAGQSFFFDAPRPDQSQNSFCLSCHEPNHPATLNILDALIARPAAPIQEDERRQPKQHIRQISGNLPAGLFPLGPNQPTSGLNYVDEWIYPDIQ